MRNFANLWNPKNNNNEAETSTRATTVAQVIISCGLNINTNSMPQN